MLDILHECLPSGNGGKQTAARWAPKMLVMGAAQAVLSGVLKYPARVPGSGSAGKQPLPACQVPSDACRV